MSLPRLKQRRISPALHMALAIMLASSLLVSSLVRAGIVHALDAGGDTSVVDPETGHAVSIDENSREPESPNIRLQIPTLADSDDGMYYIGIMSVTGGTLKDADGYAITLGADGDWLYTNGAGYVDFWFTPTANRNTNASFTYVLYHYADDWSSYDTSAESTVTIPITPVDVAPTLTTANGWTGTGLTGTYYRTDYDLTGDYSTRVDPTIDFESDAEGECGVQVWDMDDMCPDDFSVRWTGQVKAPADGDYSFLTDSDDGARLWVDGQLLIDDWTTHASTTDISSQTVHFTAGSTHNIELDYYERGGAEQIDLQWAHDTNLEDYEDVPTEDMYPGTIRPQLTYVVGSSAVAVDDGVAINDVDSTTMAGATVAITSNYQSGEDVLHFTNQHGITGSFDAGTGVLTLSGTASVADYQAALRSVTYSNSNSSDPDTSTRTVQFAVNDGEKDSNYTTRDIAFSTVNSPPTILEGEDTSVTMSEDGDPTPFDLTLDADDPNFDPISWSIVGAPVHGTASVDSSGNTVNVHYTPGLHYSGDDSFKVRASDGKGGTDMTTVHVTVTPFSDGDNIDTSVEDAAPNDGDANNDGVLDSRQGNVSTFVDDSSNHYASVAVDDACTLTDVSAEDQQTTGGSDTGYSYPFGLVNFTANCGTDGFTTTVTQYFYNPPTGNFVLRKFVNGAYATVPDATVSRQTINGQAVLVVSYTVTDGGPLDADGTENGIIVDPAGPALATTVGVPNTGLAVEHTKLFVAAGTFGIGLFGLIMVATRRLYDRSRA